MLLSYRVQKELRRAGADDLIRTVRGVGYSIDGCGGVS